MVPARILALLVASSCLSLCCALRKDFRAAASVASERGQALSSTAAVSEAVVSSSGGPESVRNRVCCCDAGGCAYSVTRRVRRCPAGKQKRELGEGEQCKLAPSLQGQATVAEATARPSKALSSTAAVSEAVVSSSGGPESVRHLLCCCDAGGCAYSVTRRVRRCPAGKTKLELGEEKRCKLAPGLQSMLKPQKISDERQTCKLQTRMNEKIFPPERFSGYAIRMAVPGIPLAGDVFFAVKDLSIGKGSFFFDFRRIDDSTFHFSIHGDGADNHENGLAEFDIFLQGLELFFSSGRDKVIKAAHLGGLIVKNLFKRGIAGVFSQKDSASLGNVPVGLKTRLSGDIRLDAEGQWRVVPESRSQYATLVLQNRGLLWGLYNKLLDNAGGMDAIFFDRVWPIVEKLVPAAIGEAFQQMPLEEGWVSQKLQVSMRCGSTPDPSTHFCPGEHMKVSIKSTTDMDMNPHLVIDKLHTLGYFTASKSIAQRMLDSYEQGSPVFKDAHVDLTVDAQLDRNKELSLSISPRFNTPMSLFASIVGPSVDIFIPHNGDPLTAKGGLTAHDGAVTLKGMKVQGVTLPVGADGKDSISIGAGFDFEVELEDSGGNPSFENHAVFGRAADRHPLDADLPNLAMFLFSGGRFVLSPDPAMSLKFSPQGSSDIFRAAGMSLLGDPINIRDEHASVDDADGPVPGKFEQPFAKPPRGLDIDKMLQSGTLKAGVHVSPIGQQSKEHIQSTITVEGEFEVAMGRHVYATFMDNLNPDLGYMHYKVGGMFQYGKDQTPGVVYLSCGFLRFYRLFKKRSKAEGQQPFNAKSLFLELDLKDGVGKNGVWKGPPVSYPDKVLRREPNKLPKDQVKCMYLGKRKKLVALGKRYYFCADKAAIEDLAWAVDTQVRRLDNAKQRWRSACTPRPGGGAPICSHSPDGTWFKDFEPLDPQTWFPSRKMLGDIEVASPKQEWTDALKMIF